MRVALPEIIRTLIASRNPAADTALATALAEAEPQAQEALVGAVLERGTPVGLAALVATYHSLIDSQRRRVLEAADGLYGAIRDAASASDARVRLNAIAIVANAHKYRLAYILAWLLRDRSPRVREAAAHSIRSLTEHYLSIQEAEFGQDVGRDGPIITIDRIRRKTEDRQRLAEAAAAGIESFDTHHHPPVVEAALWLVDDLGQKLWDAIFEPGSHIRRTVVELLHRSMTPHLAPFVLEATAYSELRPTIWKVLSGTLSPETLHALARESWRLADETLARAARALRTCPALAGHWPQLMSGPAEVQVQAIRFVARTGLATDLKAALFHRAVTEGPPEARRAAVWALCDMPSPDSSLILRRVNEAGEPDLAAIARRELRRRSRAPLAPPTETTAARSAPAEASPFDRYWAEFDALPPEEQAARGRELLTRPDCLEALRSRLTGMSSLTKVRALRIAAVAGCGAPLQATICELVRDADPMVRSTAASALGSIPNPTSQRLLRECLNDPDSRVRANAVEALERISATDEPGIWERLDDEDNRTRANAAKALLKLGVREAAETLCRMLRDADAEQRKSALWVVGELRLASLVRRIQHLAEADPESEVRQQAQQVLGSLDGDPAGTVGAVAG